MKSKYISFPLFLFAFVLFFQIATSHAKDYNVGYRSFSMWKQKDHIRLDVSLWYPTRSGQSNIRLSSYVVSAARNASILKVIDDEKAAPLLLKMEEIKKLGEEKKLTKEEVSAKLKEITLPHKGLPLIVLSHDSGTSRYHYYTLAKKLASQGYLVASPTHHLDSAQEMPLINTAIGLRERAKEISACLDLLLSEEKVASYIDTDNISYLGIGNGGMAGLVLLDIDMVTTQWEHYCDAYQGILGNLETDALSPLFAPNHQFRQDFMLENNIENATPSFDPYCAPPLKAQMDTLIASLQEIYIRKAETNKFYAEVMENKAGLIQVNKERIEKRTATLKKQNKGLAQDLTPPPFIQPYFPELAKELSFTDDRFNRMIFLSPGLSFLFNPEQLKALQTPVLLVGLTEDPINIPLFQSKALWEMMNPKSTNYRQLENIDPWGIQAPCPEEEYLPEICETATEEERELALDTLTSYVLDFVPRVEIPKN